MNFSIPQLIFLSALVCCALGIALSMLVLTWAMVKKNSSISTTTAGKWIAGFLLGLILCYTVLVAIS